jgi:phage gp36-like protein
MYCTQDDLLALIPPTELAQLTAESGDTPDAAVVADAIAQAGAEIDSYLAVRYRLPLAATPDRIKSLAADIAIYHLYSRRSLMHQVRLDKYTQAIAFLKDVAAGRARILGADAAEEPGAAENVVEVTSSGRVFSRDKMGGW